MTTSDTLTELAKALIQAQLEIKNTPATKENPHFRSRYTPLDDVLDMARSVLPKYGLTVLQGVSGASETISVVTRILHVSGEWIESDPLVMKAEKSTPQGQGSAITYARRYSLSGILGIATDPDDDGNEATKPTDKPQQYTPTGKTDNKPPEKAKPQTETAPNNKPNDFTVSTPSLSDKVSKADLAPIIEECKKDRGQHLRFQNIYKKYGYVKADDILKSDWQKMLDEYYNTALPFELGE